MEVNGEIKNCRLEGGAKELSIAGFRARVSTFRAIYGEPSGRPLRDVPHGGCTGAGKEPAKENDEGEGVEGKGVRLKGIIVGR